MNRLPRLHLWLPFAAFCLLAGLTFVAYYRGLFGSFLLDDWGTLAKLGDYGVVNNFDTLISYLTSGISGPTGRPLSLLTFLIDARSWPAGAWPFKLTNVLLHLANGALLAWLLAGLGRARGWEKRQAAWIGILGAGLWLAHPLFVSTTLYVVQRMAMLAAFFVFAGLGCYVTGRRRLQEGLTRRGYAWMATGLVGCGILGFISKENAALLPLLALVLEFTVLREMGSVSRSNPSNRKNKVSNRSTTTDLLAGNADIAPAAGSVKPHWLFRLAFLWLPSILIVAYLLWQLRTLGVISPGRNFGIGTRLLTEARVVVDYLYLLAIPHAETHGLYVVFPLSHGFLHPWSTLPCIVLIAGLIAFAAAIRKRLPVLAAAILFFFAGQLIESTTIPLEIYFEHRNYLPAALLFWPLAAWGIRGAQSRWIRYGAFLGVFALLLVLTGLRASLWGHPLQLSYTWARLNPDSPRAIITAADRMEAKGRNLAAYGIVYEANRTNPVNVSLALGRISAACRLQGARPDDVTALEYAVRHDWTRLQLLYKNLSPRIGSSAAACPGFGNAVMSRVVRAAAANPNYKSAGSRQTLALLRGQLLLARGDFQGALMAFEQAERAVTTPDVALTTAAWLLNAKQPRLAERMLNFYATLPRPSPHWWTMSGLHRRWLEHIGWYHGSFDKIRAAIREQEQK